MTTGNGTEVSACLRVHSSAPWMVSASLGGTPYAAATHIATSVKCSKCPPKSFQASPKPGINQRAISVQRAASGYDLPRMPHYRPIDAVVGTMGGATIPRMRAQCSTGDRLPLMVSNLSRIQLGVRERTCCLVVGQKKR